MKSPALSEDESTASQPAGPIEGVGRSAVDVMAWALTRLVGAPRLAAPPDAPTIWLSPTRVEDATRAARRLFGAAARPGAPLSELLHALERGDAALAECVQRLLDRGEPFRRRAPLDGGRMHDVEGAPVGAVCLLMLRDAHEDALAIARAEARTRRAEAEAALLRATLDAMPVPVWREDEAGARVWRNAAADALDRAMGAARSETNVQRVTAPEAPGAALVSAKAADRRGEAALRQFVETVTETFAHLRVGLAIYDANRRLMLSNPAMAEIFGADPRWLAGRPSLRETLDRLRETRRLPEQADYPAWRATLFTLFDDPARANYEDVWELPDGRGIHVVARPHPLGGIAFMFEDFTESMALQRWRSTAVEVRRATLDMLGEGVVVFGPDGQTRIANPACRAIWRLGAETADDASTAPPGHVADFAAACIAAQMLAASNGARTDPHFARDDDPGEAATLWRRIRDAVSGGGGRASWRGRVRLADGRVIDARVAPMPDGSTLAAFSDITAGERVAAALRERAEALEAAAAMRDALVDQLSHRLRTPLNAIFGFAQMLHAGRTGPLTDQQAEYVAAIESAARVMLDGVEHLSDLISTHAALAIDAEADAAQAACAMIPHDVVG